MSRIRADKIVNRAGTGAPELPFGVNAPNGLNVTGIVTATSFRGDGSQLSGVDASTLKDGNDVKVQATATGATVTGNLDVSGNINAASITGDGSNLTGVGGIGDPQGATNNLNYLFTSPELLALTQNTTISATQAQGSVVFTASKSLTVGTGVTVEVAAGTTVRTNVLGLF